MAITAKFVADFSEWKAGVQSAQTELGKLKGSTEATGKALATMSDAAAGRFSVSTAEMKKAGFATDEWAGKMGGLNSILNAVGLNIGNKVGAIGSLTANVGKLSASFGTLGTAASAAGAALIGWNIGRQIADVLGLDKAVADLATSMGLFADPALATAAAKQDVLAKATQTAGRDITSYTEALAINQQAHDDWILTTGYSRDAASEAGQAYAKMYGELGAVRKRGDLPALKQQLESYDFSLATLSKRFGVHIDTLELYRQNLKAAEEQEKAHAKVLEEQTARALEAAKVKAQAFSDAWSDIATQDLSWMSKAATGLQVMVDKFDAMVLAELEAQRQLAAFKSAAAAIAPDSLEGLTASYDQLKAKMDAAGASATQQELAYLQYQQAFLQAGSAADDLGTSVQAAGAQTFSAAGQAAAAAPSYQALGAAVQYAAGSFQNLYTQVGHGAGYETALRTTNDMFSEYARAGVPVHGGLIPGAGRGASSVNVTIQGSVLGTVGQIQDAMMQAYRQGGNRLPV
jgi:hypothetical protein